MTNSPVFDLLNNKKKKGDTTTTSDAYSARNDLFQSALASRYKSQWQNDYESWSKKSVGYISDSASRFSGDTSKYRTSNDASDWLMSSKETRNELDKERKHLASQLSLYGKYWGLDDDAISSFNNTFKETNDAYQRIEDMAILDSQHWSQWNTEEDYLQSKAQSDRYNNLLKMNIKDAENELSERKEKRDFINQLQSEIGPLYKKNSLADDEQWTLQKWQYDIDDISNKYGWGTGLELFDNANADVSQRAQDIRLAKIYQIQAKAESLASDAAQDNAAYKKTVNDGATAYQYGIGGDWDLSYMDDREKELFFYLLGDAVRSDNEFSLSNLEPDDPKLELVNEYIDSFEEIKTNRSKAEQFKKFKGNTALELLYAVPAGLAQFGKGVANLFNDDDYIAPTGAEVMSSLIREDLGDKWKIGDWSAAQTVYDAGTSISNMLPTILTSAAITYATKSPHIGGAVGSTLMGASVSGNAYAEMLNLGYDKKQAAGYGFMVGASEAGMQYLLGGISKLGGSLTSNFAKNLISGVDKAVARVAINTGVNMVGEFTEEALQEVLDPWYRRVAGMSEKDAGHVDIGNVLYAGLLGAISAGLLEGPGNIATEVNTYRYGKNISQSSEAVSKLKELGSNMSTDSAAYRLSEKINENSTAYQIGRAFYEVGAEMSESNISNLKENLVAKGVAGRDASVIVSALQSTMQGKNLTDKQIKALENNDVLTESVNEVILQAKEYSSIARLASRAVSVAQGKKNLAKIDKAVEKLSRAVTKAETALLGAYADLSAVKTATESEGSTQTFIEEVKSDERYTTDEKFKTLADEYIAASDAYSKSVAAANARRTLVDVAESSLKTEEERKADAKARKAAQAESKVQHKYEVSDTGDNLLTSTGESVDIQRIVTNKDGSNPKLAVKTKAGSESEVNLSDVAFSSEGAAIAYEVVTDMAIPANYMNQLVRTAELGGENIALQMHALAEAFGYGEIGLTDDNVKRFEVADYLTEGQLKIAVNLGRQNSTRNTQREQREIEVKKEKSLQEFRIDLKHNKSKGKKGSLSHSFTETEIAKMKKESPEKYETLKYVEALSSVMPADFVLYDSSKNGERKDANGYYHNGTVYLDINANVKGENTVLFTLSHELVHYIKDWSPAKYKVLADFLFNEFAQNNVAVNELINNKVQELESISAYKNLSKAQIKEIAYEEIVAESCQRMLVDSSVVEKLAKRDVKLFNKMKQFIQNFCNKIVQRYKKLKPQSQEAQLVSEISGMAEKLQRLFEDAIVDASQNQRIISVQKNTADSGVRMQLREMGLDEFSKQTKNNIKMRKGVLIETMSELKEHINLALTTDNKRNLYFGAIAEDAKSKIEKDVNASVFQDKQYSFVVSYDDIIHISDHFGTNPEVIADEIIRLYDIVKNYDNVKLEITKQGTKKLIFDKSYSDYDYRSVEIASNKKSTLDLVTFYITKNNIKRKGNQSVPPATQNSSSQWGSVPSNNSITNETDSVNIKYQLKDSAKESTYDNAVEKYIRNKSRYNLNKVREIVNEAASRAMPDSVVRDERGMLLKVYHGTEAGNFNVFDKARRGQTDSSLWGRGYYFSSEFDFANDFGENVRGFYLNITNPFVVTKVDAPATDIANRLKAMGIKVDFDYSKVKAYEFANHFGNQRFTDVLKEQGYDGVIVEDFEYVAFDQDQMKLADAITYDDKGDVIPLEERFSSENSDIRFQQKKVDSKEGITDNKTISNGGAVNGSQNTELLEQGTVSAVGRNYDPIWQQSESAQKILGYLGVVRKRKTQNETDTGASDSGWLEASSYQQQIDKGFEAGILRTLRGVKLSGKDTIGRDLSESQIDKLRDTIFKDKNGNVISMFHWTTNCFDVFRYGDIGFHFGTVDAAHDRYEMLKEENAKEGKETPVGIYKEVYLNITKPIYMPDLGQWTAYDIALFLEINGLITEYQYNNISKTIGFYDLSYDNPAAVAVRQILANLGYDGIVYYNQSEDLGSISAIALYSEQVMMVTDNGVPVNSYMAPEAQSGVSRTVLNNHLPKMQLKSLEAMSDTELMAKYLEENSKAVKTVLRKTALIEINPVKLERLVKRTLRQYGISSEGIARVADIVPSILESAKIDSVKGSDIVADLTDEIAKAIDNTTYTESYNTEERQAVVDVLKSFDGRVYLNAEQIAHLKENDYNVGWLRGRLFGKLNVVKESEHSKTSETPFSEVYMHLSQEFPHIFNSRNGEVDSSEYALDLVNKLDELAEHRQITVEEAFGTTSEEVAVRAMSDLIADVVQEKYNSRKNPYITELISHLNKQRDSAVKKQRAQSKQSYNKLKAKYAEREAEIKKNYRERTDKAREKRKSTELRNNIKKVEQDLRRMLTHPTDSKHVPSELVNSVIDVLSVVNMDTVEADARIAKYDKMIAEANAKGDFAKAEELAVSKNNIKKQGDKLKDKLEGIASQYKKLKEANQGGVSVYDEDVKNMLDILTEEVGNVSVRLMTKGQLQMVYDTFKSLKHIISEANRVRIEGKEASAYAMGKEAVRVVNDVTKPKDGVFSKWVTQNLRADVMFNRMGGYAKNNAMLQLGKLLNEGQLKQTQLQSDGASIMTEVMSDTKNLAKLFDAKNLVDIGLRDDNGNAVEIPRDMMLAVYMHLTNEQNAKHFYEGGLTVPDIKAYYNGNLEKAFGTRQIAVRGISQELYEINRKIDDAKDARKAAKENGDTEVFEENNQKVKELEDEKKVIQKKGMEYAQRVLNNIEAQIERDGLESGQLGAYEKLWIKTARYLFDVWSRNARNEATERMYGHKKANVDNYFRIKSDKAYLRTSFDTVVSDFSLEGMGSMKARVNSGKPILLEGLSSVMADTIRETAAYAGLAPAIKDFNKVWSVTLGGNADSVQKAIQRKFGEAGVNWVADLIADLQGVRGQKLDGFGKFLAKARGNYAQAVLSVNIGVTLGQAASYPTAAAEIGWSPLIKALLKGGQKDWMFSKADKELIRKYSPLLWYRLQGGGKDVEIGEAREMNTLPNMTKKKARFLMNWISQMDGATVGRLWYAAQYYVSDNFKELEKGGDRYYRKVAEVFNNIVEKTQPNYTTMQRATVLRSNNQLVKVLTMFMTQRLQNFNIVYDATSTMIKYKKDFKNGMNGVTAQDVKTANIRFRRAVLSQTVQAVVYVSFKFAASLLTYSMNSFRDDDDELTAESIAQQLAMNYFETLIGSMLGGGELFKIVKGLFDRLSGERTYSSNFVSVNGIDSINDLETAIESFVGQDWENFSAESVSDLLVAAGNVLGAPLGNIKKLGEGIYKHIVDAVEGTFGEFEQDVKRTATQQERRLYEALVSGNKNLIADVYNTYEDDDEYEKVVKSCIRKYSQPLKAIVRVKNENNFGGVEAEVTKIAQSLGVDKNLVNDALLKETQYFNEHISSLAELFTERSKDADSKKAYTEAMKEFKERYKGVYTYDELFEMIKSYKPAEDTGEEQKAEETVSSFSSSDMNKAFDNGNFNDAIIALNDLIDTRIANNKSKVGTKKDNGEIYTEEDAEKDARSSVKSTVTSYWKPKYQQALDDNDTNEQQRIRSILERTGLYENVWKTTKGWIE